VRILVVEDDQIKFERISRAIAGVDGELERDLEHAEDIRGARLKLLEIQYDLLVLDVVLPLRAKEPPRMDAGLLLLDELARREGRYRLPGYTIGITQFESVYDQAQARFQEHTLSVVRYETDSDNWVETLQAGVRYVMGALESRESARLEYGCEAAILCALAKPELSAVKTLPWAFRPKPLPQDDTPYYEGFIPRDSGTRRVYAAAAPRMGMQASAVLATKMVFNFRPRYLIMVGITAGIKGRTRSGDLLVADPCWDWGSGKWEVKNGHVNFAQAPHQIGVSPFFRGLMQQLSSDDAALSAIQASWQGPPNHNRLSLHAGPVASGAAVVADEGTMTQILDQHRQLLGIEMETYGVYAAAEEAPNPRPKALSIKAVVDHGDKDKSDEWQRYAAFVSARTVQHVLERLVP
jgi:nucleoside phosphorylase/CheY-like chemotaxis protein